MKQECDTPPGIVIKYILLIRRCYIANNRSYSGNTINDIKCKINFCI